MKLLLITTIFLSNFLFANSIYNQNNSGKIDMHGGKEQKLLDEKNSLSNKDLNKIGVIKPTLPNKPKEPENLIKKEKKEDNK